LGWVAAVDFRRGGNGCADQPCRNFGKLEKLHNGVVLGAVADGMETAAYGHLGAKVSVRSGLSAARANAEDLSAALASGSREARDTLFAKVMETVDEGLRQTAWESGVPVSELATSLTVFFAGPFGLAAMQIGANLLVYRPRGGEYGVVFEPMADDADPTVVTAPEAADAMRVGYLRGPMEFLCIASRAFQPVSFCDKNAAPAAPFFRPLDRYASVALDDGEVHRGIREFLRTNNLSREIDDDLILALCRYNPGHRIQ